MGYGTKIGWTDATINFWWGCVEVSAGCDNCYARELAKRFGRDVWGVHNSRFFTKNPFGKVLKWQRQAEAENRRIRVFSQSMSDLFEKLDDSHPDAARMNEIRAEFFERIIPACPSLDFQMLTKRGGNYRKMVPASWMAGAWPSNAWAGISVVNQMEVDRDISKLTVLPAPIKFLSVEPLIEWVRFDENELAKLSWVIVGGESGPKARPFDVDWASSIRDQCDRADVRLFVKQLGQNPRFGPERVSTLDTHGTDWLGFDYIKVRDFPALPTVTHEMAEGDGA